MRRIGATAPGKLVLSGEYAVLDGAAAISVAIHRRAAVFIVAGDGDSHTVVAPGHSDAVARFTCRRGAAHWSDDGAGYGLFAQVWSESRVSPPASIDITLDTRAFRDNASGRKLGIGSSAALSAALATALSGLGGEEPGRVAMRAHRRFQGGRGSGVDVATSLSGGVIRYRIADDRPCPLDWPQGLHYSVYWSGTSVDTSGKLERFGSEPATDARLRLAESADRFAGIFAAGDAGEVLAGLQSYCASLRRFDDRHRLDVYAAGHEVLADAAVERDIVYKPCGAGGGDIGIALATSEDALASFSSVAGRAGFRRLDATIDHHGAMLIEEDQA